MKRTILFTSMLYCMIFMLVNSPDVLAQEKPTPDEAMKSLEEMCAKSSEARAKRHLDTPLYERLGGYEKLLELTTEIVRLHAINKDIKHLVENVDHENLAREVADFVAAGTGGNEKYTGRSLPDSHKHLHLTNADFLAAGADIIKAMQNLGYGENEINEVVCILVSLRDQVVFD